VPGIGFFIVLAVFVAFIIVIGRQVWRANKDTAAAREKQEAFFKVRFPELQPYFHPEKVLQFVTAWRARRPTQEIFEWNNPPAFGFAKARFGPTGEKGRPVEFFDATGAVLSRVLLEEVPEGGVIRLGAGKLTANLRDGAVRYWHPEREFKWSKLKGWRVMTPLSDRPIDSNDHGTSFSSDSPSSSFSSSGARAGTAAMAGAGGAFDGGGASDSWENASSSAESRTSY